MADNVNDSLKNLNQNIKDADENLAKLSKDFNVVFTEAVTRAARDAKVSIDQMFDAIAGRVGASKASKLKLLFDIVDEHGKTATPQTIQQKIDRIVNGTPNARGTKIHIGMDWVDVDTANANLRRYKEQLKLLQDMPAAYDLVNRAVNAIIGEFDKEAAAKQKIIDQNEKILQQEIAIEEKQRSKAAAQQQKQEEKQYKEEQKWYDAKAKADRENERRAGEAKYRQMSKEIAEYGKALQRQIELETKANQIRRDYNRIKSDLQGISKRSEEYKKGQQVLQQYRQELHNVYQEQKKIDNEYKGTRSAVYNQQRINGLRQEYEQLRRNGRQIKENKSSLESMLPTLRRLAGAFGVAFSVQGLVQFGKKLVETRGEFELQQVALRSILQNKQLADEIWDKTMQAALQSPFTAMQLTKYTKQLAAYRIETDKLFDTTKRLADVSAGLGVDMQRLILAYGQVKAANYLRASEIRQFTEAGVNVLGELTSYFNETRDGMYNTAKVMDMVQKRMVTFSDIEAIFKRMTDEGGIFFNMQYIQSQTVKGQINKLRDAYDQMLNSIGKANEGPIKNMVSLLLNIVKNWREWKTVLDSILWPTLTIAVIKFSRGLLMVDASAKIASKSLHGLTLAGAKVNRGLSTILNTLKKFPVGGIWGALGLGVAFVGVTALINHANAVAAINKEYDEQKNRLRETARSLEDYQNRVNENNQTIKNRINLAKDDKDGQDKVQKAQRDNKSIVEKLTSDYPEFAKSIKLASDKQADLGTIVEDTNARLRDQVALLEASKAGFGFDDLKTNIEEFQGTTLTQEEQVRNNLDIAQNLYQEFLDWKKNEEAKAREEYAGNERKLQKRLKKIRETELPSWITDIINAGTDAEAQTEALQGVKNLAAGFISYSRGRELKKLIKMPTGQTDGPLGTFQKTQEDTEKDLRSSLQRLGMRIRIMYRAELEKLNNGAIEDAKKYVAENGTIVDAWFKFGEGEGWKYLNQRVVSLSNTLGVSIDEARKIVEEEVNKVLMSAYGKTIKLDWSKVETDSTDQETPEEKRAKIDDAWRRRIQLLEEMKRRYDELSKAAYGYAKSEMTVRQAFDDVRDANGNVIEKGAFSTIFAGTGITMDQIDFTSMEGMFKSMRLALQQAKGISDAVRDEIMKKIDSYEAQITINAQVKIREDFDKEMEKMFSDYELTLDLKKLSLPTGELEGIFDFDLTTIDALRKAVDTFYNEQKRLGADPTDLTKQVEGYYKKIDDMERKALLERLKTYTEYLTQGRDKAVQIHLDELNKMAEIDELYYKRHYSLEQYRGISSQIKRDTEKKLQENEWREFKESDFYTTMFEDLDHVATSSIDLMISELKKLQKNLNNLDPTQVKEIVKAIDNLEKRKRSRSPLKSFVEDFKTMLRWQKERDGYENALAPKLALKDILEERYKRDVLSVAKAEQEYNKLALDGLEGNEAEAKKYWDERLAALNLTKEQLEQVKDEIAEINEKNNEGYGAWVRTYQGISRGAQYFSEMASAAGTIATEMMDMFDGVEDASKKLASDIADIAGNTAALGGDIAKAIASEGSDVGSMIDGLVRTWNIIKGIFSASEADINRTVERETEKLEILEHSLDRVKRARDRAWDTAKIIESEKETEKAINDMIASYRALIAAEQARKNPDENNIRQWMNEIEQLYEQLEEEREDFIGKFGGIGESGYLSAAEGFVEAWKSAFLETGDGLQGLQDHFDEFLQDWFVKQATMRIASRMLQPMFDSIDKAVDENSDGGVAVTMRELDALREWADVNFPLISDNLEDLAGMFGVGGEGGLSGLAAGIQGMTEEQANILEAYWNSVRMYTASIDMNVSRIAEMLGAGGPNTNPMLAQLQTIADNTGYIKDIYKMLDGTRRNLGNGQGFITYNQ